jgi:hypothetical protein
MARIRLFQILETRAQGTLSTRKFEAFYKKQEDRQTFRLEAQTQTQFIDVVGLRSKSSFKGTRAVIRLS